MAEHKINREEPIQLLRQFVSDSFVVYMKSYAVHWNYHGPKFFSIHKLTEGQYAEQAEAVDTMAERIRALGGKAPLSLADILADSNIAELKSVSQNQDSLIRQLYESNVKLAEKAVDMAPKEGNHLNTLGVAHYRAGDWKAAIEALEKSKELLGDTELSFNAFFLAMAHWKLDQKEQARKRYDQAVQWMDKNAAKDEEMIRFRAEAAELLEMKRK